MNELNQAAFDQFNGRMHSHRADVQDIWRRLLRPAVSANRKDYGVTTEDLINVDISILVHDHSVSSLEEWAPFVVWTQNVAQKREESSKMPSSVIQALSHHHRKNPHHWQHWVSHMDTGEIVAAEMPNPAILEMVCDWHANGVRSDRDRSAYQYYQVHKDTIYLGMLTRGLVEQLLELLKDPYVRPDPTK